MMKETANDSPAERLMSSLARKYQILLDKTVVHLKTRWAVLFFLWGLYWLRVYSTESHYIVTYGALPRCSRSR